ncbi:MAG: hexapeptide transferase [Bacilli bacterium]|nr:hexapeptide transferase [Bacilli bacterium]
MSKIKYIIRCITRMDYKNMFQIAKKVSKKSRKPILWILIDIIYCGLKYGAGYYDYQEFEFYRLTKKERENYLTRTKNNLIIKKYNNKEYFHILDNKVEFNNTFKDFIKREYMLLDQSNEKDFEIFLKKHKEVIVKPLDGEGGKGVEKITYQKDMNLEKLYQSLIEKKQLLVEEVIMQQESINKLYSGSVNTLRLFTFFDGKEAHVLNQVFKIGNGGVTDNFSSGSMYTFVDEEGKILVPAIDQNDRIYKEHPITHERIIGFQIPYFKEACNFVCEAAKIIPEVKYIGWDVAISKKGPVIIEGNSFPGVFQIKPSLMKNQGLIPKYQKYMDIK